MPSRNDALPQMRGTMAFGLVRSASSGDAEIEHAGSFGDHLNVIPVTNWSQLRPYPSRRRGR
jgi:hypothetical protein